MVQINIYAMQLEIMSLSVLADLYHPSNYMDVRTYNAVLSDL